MGFIRMDCAFTRQQMKWSKFEIAERVYRPAILSIRNGVSLNCIESRSSVVRQGFQAGYTQRGLCDKIALGLKPAHASIPHRRILFLKQFLGLCRPGHQLAIKAEPVASEFIPKARPLRCRLKADEELSLQAFIGKEAAARARIDGAERALHHSETLLRDTLVFAQHNHSPRAHVLLFADNG